MRALLISIALALPLISAPSSAGNTPQQVSIFNLGQKFSQNFPFGATGQTSVLPQSDGTVQVCASGIPGCVKVEVPNKVQFAKAHVSGPFVSSASPSWIALGDNATYLCSITEGRAQADCVQLAQYTGRDVDITVTRRGVIPILTVTSTTQSADYIASYTIGLKSALKAASQLLRQRAKANGDVTTEMPIIDVPGTPGYPDPGTGGIKVVSIGDIGEATTTGGGKTRGGVSALSATSCPIQQENPETVVICGSGGGADDPIIPEPPSVGPADPGIGSDQPGAPPDCNSPGASSCPVPSNAELLQRCLAGAETLYYDVSIPTCQRNYPVGSAERAVCYAEAAEIFAADRNDCRASYPL